MYDERGVNASYAAAEGLPPIDWSLGAVAAPWPTLDHLRRQGVVVVIKLDGQRQSDEFTVVINGTSLGDGTSVRRDAGDVETGLVGALVDFLLPGR